jgi:hypothetical protein
MPSSLSKVKYRISNNPLCCPHGNNDFAQYDDMTGTDAVLICTWAAYSCGNLSLLSVDVNMCVPVRWQQGTLGGYKEVVDLLLYDPSNHTSPV